MNITTDLQRKILDAMSRDKYQKAVDILKQSDIKHINNLSPYLSYLKDRGLIRSKKAFGSVTVWRKVV